MTTEITLDLLATNSVTVKTTNVFENDGFIYRTPPHAKAYINSKAGRAELQVEVSEPYLSAIMAVWSDVLTVEDTVTPPEGAEDADAGDTAGTTEGSTKA